MAKTDFGRALELLEPALIERVYESCEFLRCRRPARGVPEQVTLAGFPVVQDEDTPPDEVKLVAVTPRRVVVRLRGLEP